MLLLAKAAVGTAKRATIIAVRMSRLVTFFFVGRALSLSRQTVLQKAFFMGVSFSLTDLVG
jgi:hypothetical protein